MGIKAASPLFFVMGKEYNDRLAIFLNEETSSFMRLEPHHISLLDSRVGFEY